MFVPINICNQHWVLVVVYFRARVIQYYDSLRWPNGPTYVALILRYLEFMWYHCGMDGNFDKTSWTTVSQTQDTPIQGLNTNNCALYVCMFAERISAGEGITVTSNVFDESCRGRWWVVHCYTKII